MIDIELKSFPFDSMKVLNEESGQMEGDRRYDAKTFREYFKMFLSNGVYYGNFNNYGENGLKVVLDGGLNIKVLKGMGMIEGADYQLPEDEVIALERPTAGTRIDRVVIRLDDTLATRKTFLAIKEGNATTKATLQRDDNIYEICIAEVTVKSTTNLSNADIKDTRLDKSLCGIVNSLITIDGEEIYQQFQQYVENIKSNLVLKNQDNTITGKLIVNGGIEANVKGTLDGNSATATKLQTARTISLSGAVKGSVSFDGTKNVTISTIQDNIAILTGNITVPANSKNNSKFEADANVNIAYPNGFTKQNTRIISIATSIASGSIWSTGMVPEQEDVDLIAYQRGMLPSYVSKNDNNLIFNVYNALSQAINIKYEVILFKI